MANTNQPFGFRPTRTVTGLGHTAGQYTIASTYAANIAVGDLVKSDGTGGIVKCGVTDTPLGVFLGYSLDSTNQGSMVDLIPFKRVWVSGTVVPAGSRVVALVDDDPFTTLEVQCEGTIAVTDLGRFVDLVDATYDSVFGRSKQVVEAPDGTGVQFRIERIIEKAARQTSGSETVGYGLTGVGAYAILEVKYVKHERGGTSLAVAV